MGRAPQYGWAVVLAAALLLVGGPAIGGGSVSKLIRKLKHEDFRIRAQAALSLGRSGSPRAVKPLCGSLSDDRESVRVAAAWGLGKLRQGGEDCLRQRLKREPSSSVKKKLRRALRRVASAGNGELGKGTKYYLAIGRTKDDTGRGSMEVDNLVRTTLRRASSALERSVVAPNDETSAQAKTRLRKHKHVDGFLLNPVVHRPKYQDGSVTVRLDILCYSYPDKVLKGTVSRTAKLAGVGSKDSTKENELIKRLSESAMQQVAQLVAMIE